MDVIGVYSAGVHNVVASCGTALTNTQVRALKRHSERIVVNFDPDTAGANAAERSIQMLLDENLQVRVLELERRSRSRRICEASWRRCLPQRLENAPAYFHWLADRAREKFDMRTVEGRLEAFKFVAPAIQRISDRLERFAVANDVADYLGVDEKLVRDHFAKGRDEQPRTSGAHHCHPTSGCCSIRCSRAKSARVQAIPELSGMAALDRFVTRNIFKALFAMHTDDVPVPFFRPGGAPFGGRPGSIVVDRDFCR